VIEISLEFAFIDLYFSQFSIDIPDDLLMKIAAINNIEFEEWGSWNIDAKNSEAFVDESSYLCMASTLAQRELKRRGISAQWANGSLLLPIVRGY